ncbi:MAG: fibronectin type III domain-containing protein [Bacteroidia bacterium]|nr:fibronectin type III domain-containing protein [Bacteroidia bacterium]MDW8157799.1 fibronectin type III domain-containing protein [Bacteroidia bacterium]
MYLGIFLLGLGSLRAQPCSKVEGLSATIVLNNSARITWQPVLGARGYEVVYKVQEAGFYLEPQVVTTTAINLNNLLPCRTYEVQVKALCSSGSSEPAEIRFTTTGCVNVCQNAPTGLTVTNISANGARLFWNAVNEARAYALSIRKSNESTGSTLVVRSPSYDFTDLDNCSQYVVELRALCANEITTPSITTTFSTIGCIPPCSQTPDNIVTGAIEENNATVVWNAVVGATGYEVAYRRLADTAYTLAPITPTNQIRLTGLDFCTQYEVLVRARCGANQFSRYSLGSFATNGCRQTCDVIVRGLTVSNVTRNSAKLMWDGIPGVLTYEVSYRAENEDNYSEPILVNCNFVNLDLKPCTYYEVRVRARCGQGNYSPYAYTSIATEGCDCLNNINNLSVVSIGQNTAELAWFRVDNAIAYEVSYAEEGEEDLDFSPPIVVTITRATVDGLRRCTPYVFRMRAICGPNRFSNYAIARAQTQNCECLDPPSNLATYVITQNTATLTWLPDKDARFYEVAYRKKGQANFSQPILVTTAAVFIEGLERCTEYEVIVRTYCRSDIYSPYDTISFQTVGCIPLCEIAPPNPIARNETVNSVTIEWEPVSGALYYEVYYRLASNSNFSVPLITYTNSINLTNLTFCTSHVARVRAICGENIASEFSEVEFTTACCLDGCSTPTSLRISNITHHTAIFSWDCCVIGRQTYEVSYRKLGEARFTEPIITTQRTITLINLEPNTQYEVRVRINCNNGIFSEYASIQFTTPSFSQCATPQLITTVLDFNSARISWSAVPNVRYYQVEYRASDSNTWINLYYTNNTFVVLDKLLPNTTYQVRVRAICAEATSEYSVTTFTTSFCARPNTVTISPRSASSVAVRWNLVTEAVCYVLQYGPVQAAEQNLQEVIIPGIFNNFVINGLSSFENYKLRLRTNCGECSNRGPNISEWTLFSNFTTTRAKTGVELSASKLSVYPNPNLGNFIASFSSEKGGSYIAQLVDLQGKVVYQTTFQAQEGTNEIFIHPSSLPAGLYLFRLIGETTNEVVKVSIE